MTFYPHYILFQTWPFPQLIVSTFVILPPNMRSIVPSFAFTISDPSSSKRSVCTPQLPSKEWDDSLRLKTTSCPHVFHVPARFGPENNMAGLAWINSVAACAFRFEGGMFWLSVFIVAVGGRFGDFVFLAPFFMMATGKDFYFRTVVLLRYSSYLNSTSHIS